MNTIVRCRLWCPIPFSLFSIQFVFTLLFGIVWATVRFMIEDACEGVTLFSMLHWILVNFSILFYALCFFISHFFLEISDSNTHFLYKVVTGMVVFLGVKNSIFLLWMQHSSIFLKSWHLQWLKKLWWINEEKQEIGKLLITLSSNFLKFKSYHDPLGWIFIKKEVNGLAN